jgi:hypothetical protein
MMKIMIAASRVALCAVMNVATQMYSTGTNGDRVLVP